MHTGTAELIWLLRNTRPVDGERAAVVESWSNALRAAGLPRADIERELDAALARWRRDGADQPRV